MAATLAVRCRRACHLGDAIGAADTRLEEPSSVEVLDDFVRQAKWAGFCDNWQQLHHEHD